MENNFNYTKIKIDDLSFLHKVRNLYAKEFLHDKRLFEYDEVVDWFKKTNPNYWIISLKNEKIGYFRLNEQTNDSIWIGADIAPEFTGKGYAKIAYNEFMYFLNKEFGIKTFYLLVLKSNTRAINLYNKLGFVLCNLNHFLYTEERKNDSYFMFKTI